LNEISHCGPILPDLEFSYNLLEPKFFEISYTGESKILPVEEAYIIIISILDDNPSMTIEISGHSDSKENNPVELSLQRSKAIEDALIKRGIAKERLISKGYGCTQLLVTDDIIKKTSNKTERQALRQKNCRVSIKILNFDYKK
jgi:flagellar motor protein MotB